MDEKTIRYQNIEEGDYNINFVLAILEEAKKEGATDVRIESWGREDADCSITPYSKRPYTEEEWEARELSKNYPKRSFSMVYEQRIKTDEKT